MFKQIGPMEIILVLIIIFVFFGVGKLPQVGQAMGKAIRSFKKAQTGDDLIVDDEETVKSETEKPAKPSQTSKKAV